MAPNNRESFSWEQIVAPCGRHMEIETKNSTKRVDKQTSEKETNKNGENSTSNLGTYSASITPLFALFFGIVCGEVSFKDFEIDNRIKGKLLMENYPGMLIISVSYILFSMTWGPRLMKGRKPMQLKEVMIVYNAFQVVASAYMFIETGFVGWFFDYNFRCQPCDYSMNDKAVRMTNVAHLYFLSKILDFVDTILFILRGKLSQVTNLHVIHHSCMFMSMWYGMHYTPGGHITFMGYLNTFVHTVMYSYYLLAACGPRMKPYLWWKKYLTKLQLTQFMLIFLHTAQLLVFPCKGVPTALIMWTLTYSFLFFALFINFYIKAYLFRNKNCNGKLTEKESKEKPQITDSSPNKRDSNGNLKNYVSNGVVKNRFNQTNGSIKTQSS